MDEFEMFDPALFGLWTEAPVYGDAVVMDDSVLSDAVRGVLLEIKSAEGAFSPGEELRRLLNEMTVEMRDQFSTFRRMRTAAEAALTDGDDAAQKLARADVKAATDAMSLIVRTLEKVDSLQRQLARDRDEAAERDADEGGYEEAKARFLKMIEDRANENAYRLFEAWKRDGPPPLVLERFGHAPSEPTDLAAGSGKDGGQSLKGGVGVEPRPTDDHGCA
ncbi:MULTISPECIES: hypothetical protein [unclassified Neorhizobium]|uniref:hypothetical protein n=1 Tax=unclassified Neorhizobium TaxID=2629175 RepID=UPI001FF2C62E|nr:MULTISPECIES: hypothetical protein [unclassified Neorhizobium]MCJ9673159.1 hypothetical protein [Neorhizobium sp. SHOUNA12B]MCJ9748125.1 hypothetical protein [Neorhizobium sp. SHOUNA12A]